VGSRRGEDGVPVFGSRSDLTRLPAGWQAVKPHRESTPQTGAIANLTRITATACRAGPGRACFRTSGATLQVVCALPVALNDRIPQCRRQCLSTVSTHPVGFLYWWSLASARQNFSDLFITVHAETMSAPKGFAVAEPTRIWYTVSTNK